MNVLLQIGYQKSAGRRREGQLVRAWINEEECSWRDAAGKYLTSKMEAAKGILWYLWKGEVDPTDTVRISAMTTLAGIGPDERRTFESLYYVDPEVPVREIMVQGVGRKRYPLLKGRLVEMGSVSEEDKRVAEIEDFLRSDF